MQQEEKESLSMESNFCKPCEICGGIGYEENIVTCSKCLKTREHMYCMHPHLNYIPQSWQCEACRCHGPRRFTARKKVLLKPNSSSSQYYSTPQRGSLSRNDWTPHYQKSAVVKPEKQYIKMYARRSKPLPIGNARMSTAKNQACDISQSQNGLRSSLESPCEFTKSEDTNSQRITSVGGERHISDEACQSPENHTEPLAYIAQEKSNNDEVLLKLGQFADQVDSILCRNACQDKPVDAVLQCNESGTSESETSLKSGQKHVSNPPEVNQIAPVLLNVQQGIEFKKVSAKLDKQAGEVCTGNIAPFPLKNVYKIANADAVAWFKGNEASTSQTSYREEDTLNSPSGHSSWKGSFEILNFPLERFDGLQAYPPRRVSQNAYLASKKMPEILQFTLQPHHDLWPATFHKYCPSGLDVGLYLLPDHFYRIKEKYNGLVELMEKEDLSLRSCLNEVELLIFTSRRLPSESQRMNKQVYLWAVFISSKLRHSSVGLKDVTDNASRNHKSGEDLASISHKLVDQVVDTNIDIAGDKDVERVDKCLTRNLMDACTNSLLDTNIDIVGNKDVVRVDKCLRNRTDACTSSLHLTSQSVAVGSVLSQPLHKGTTAIQLKEVKREPNDDIGVPPGFCKRQPGQKFTVASHLHTVKNNHCNGFDPPTGFARPVKSNTLVEGATAMSPVVNKLDAPPGFSELSKFKQCASSSKHSLPVLNTNLVGKVRKTPRMRTRFLPKQLLPSSNKSKKSCSQSDENGDRGMKMAIRSPHDQLLASSDQSKISCSQSNENGGEEINVANRSPDDPMKEIFMTQFTQDQTDKMSSFAEKVGWSLSKQEDSVVQQFCQGVNVTRPALKVWMKYKKHDMIVHSSSACERKSVLSDTINSLLLKPDEQEGGGDINVTTRSPKHQVKKRLRTRFTQEKVGWTIKGQNEAEFQKSCQETDMCNKQYNLRSRPSGSYTRKSLSPDKEDVGRGFDVAVEPSSFQGKTRFKTTLTQEQRNKALSFAEKVGWSIRRQEEAVVQQFCQEIGVERRVLMDWMDSNKYKLNKTKNSSTPCTRRPLSEDRSHPLRSESDDKNGARDLNVAIETPQNKVRKRSEQCVSSGNVLPQPFHKGITATTYVQELHTERCDDLDAPPGFSNVCSIDPVQECYIAKNLHQVETDYCDDLDAPPGFSRVPSINRVQECYVAKNLHQVETDYCDDFDAPPGFSRVHPSNPVQECYAVKNPHQVESDYCNDFAPGFSRIFTSSAADVRPIATLHVGTPRLVEEVDTRPGFYESIKRRKWDCLPEQFPSIPNMHLAGFQWPATTMPILPNQLSLSSERSKPVEDPSCLCRICNLRCPGITSFMQHLKGRKHVNNTRAFVKSMRYKEDYEKHGKYSLSSPCKWKSSHAAS